MNVNGKRFGIPDLGFLKSGRRKAEKNLSDLGVSAVKNDQRLSHPASCEKRAQVLGLIDGGESNHGVCGEGVGGVGPGRGAGAHPPGGGFGQGLGHAGEVHGAGFADPEKGRFRVIS